MQTNRPVYGCFGGDVGPAEGYVPTAPGYQTFLQGSFFEAKTLHRT